MCSRPRRTHSCKRSSQWARPRTGSSSSVEAIHFAGVPPNGHRSPIRSLDHIAELAQTLAPLLEDATDAGARKSSGMEFAGRGAGFTDVDPTGTAALDPTRAQMRAAVKRAFKLIARAEDELTEAGAVIANGYLRLDRDEWIRVMEKRSAALAPIAPPIAPRHRGAGATRGREVH